MKYLMALVILLSINFTTSTAFAADNNGHGLVYHRSDCSPGWVRVYGDGGRWDGSVCGQWLSEFAMQVIPSRYETNIQSGYEGDTKWL